MSWEAQRYALTAFAISAAVTCGLAWANAWEVWAVEPMAPLFSDLSVGLAAIEEVRRGGDPVLANPLDPLGRTHIYGRIWLLLEPTGISLDDRIWIGVLMGLAMLLAGALAARPQNARQAGWTTLLLLSPSVAAGIERANADMAVFVLLAAAGWALGPRARAGAGATLFAFGMVMTATLYKFYPLASLAALMRGRSRGAALAIAAAGSAILGAYIWRCRDEIAFVLSVMPSPLGYAARRAVGAPIVLDFLGVGSPWYRLIPMVAGAAFLVWVWLRPIPRLAGPYSARAAHYFLLGVAPWLACHWAASSFSYRGLLLILALPLCFELAERGRGMDGAWKWALRLAPLWLFLAANPSHLAWAAKQLTAFAMTAAGRPLNSWNHYQLVRLYGLLAQTAAWALSFVAAALLIELSRPSLATWLGRRPAEVETRSE